MAARKSGKKKAPKNKAKKKKAQKPPFAAKDFFFAPFRFIGWATRKWPKPIRWPARIAFSGAFLGFVSLVILSIIYFTIACSYDLREVEEMPARTEIHDRNGHILRNTNGQEIGFLHGKNRRIVEYDEVSQNFVKALIATEDRRFRKHGAIDLRSMARVIRRLILRGKLEGGGTISMQLARNSYDLKRSESQKRGIRRKLAGIHRKFLETFIAVRIESKFEKNEILQHYMNRIFWGGSTRGIEVASQTYLDKPAKDLTLGESAMLAGIIRAPNKYSPFRHYERALAERDWVLKKMKESEFISEAEAEAAKSVPIKIASTSRRVKEGSYALDAIRRDLNRILEEENIRDGGLIITTTLDPNIQEVSERSMEKRLAQVENSPGYPHQKRVDWDRKGDPRYLQGAAVVIDNSTGAVLAVVGGRNANESQFNRALQAQRPVGSIFKPFMFLAAFDGGIQPYDYVSDARLKRGEISGGDPNWNPANSDRKYYKKVRVSRALVQSRNTSSIRVANAAGMDRVMDVARSAGFDPDNIDRVPSSYLGSWNASPEAVASAYTIFPNGGTRYRPYYIQSIKDRQGNVLFENGPIAYRATEAAPAWEVSRVLEEVNRSGTGRSIRNKYGFRKPSGGKTGTTNGPNDGWYAGYTSALTCAVWVGMDHGQIIKRNSSGATLALPIWTDIMKAADRLPSYENGDIAPGRAIRVHPAVEPVEEIPQAESVIPQAVPVR